MNGIFEPFHKSYRLATTLAILVGLLSFSTYYFYEKYTEVLKLLQACKANSGELQEKYNQCSSDLEQVNNDLQFARGTIAGLKEKLVSTEQKITDMLAQIDSLIAQHNADTLIIAHLKETQETCQQQEVDIQNERQPVKKDDACLLINLPELFAIQDALRWLIDYWFLVVVLVIATGAVLVLLYRKLLRLPDRLPPASSCPPDSVLVRMTRNKAREYARHSRSV